MGIKKGFTLVEVCLVMMIFGIAVTSMMALFPVGLRQGNMAVSDSVVTMFGDYVMNSLAANAAEMTDWADWESESAFKKEVVAGIKVDKGGGPGSGEQLDGSGNVKKIDDYLGIPKSHIKYKLLFSKVTDPEDFGGRLYRAVLRVTDNKNGDIDNGMVFVTYFVYGGEIP